LFLRSDISKVQSIVTFTPHPAVSISRVSYFEVRSLAFAEAVNKELYFLHRDYSEG
jgi:hypothetical protein